MAQYLLDTDILSLLQDGDPTVTSRVAATSPSDCGIAVITVEEQLTGWLTFLRRATRAAQIERGYRELGLTVSFLANFLIYQFAQPAIALFESLKRQKLNVRGNDVRIAAIAIIHRAIVVSRNVRDFARVPGLVVED